MKRWALILGVGALMVSLAVPVMAWGPGCGRGQGPGWSQDQGPSSLTPEQKTKLDELDRKFSNDTSSLRAQIWAKKGEMQALMGASNPDVEKLRTLQKEISGLKAQVEQERLNYNLEAKKISPDAGFGPGPGRGACKGQGGFGPGRGMGGCRY